MAGVKELVSAGHDPEAEDCFPKYFRHLWFLPASLKGLDPGNDCCLGQLGPESWLLVERGAEGKWGF